MQNRPTMKQKLKLLIQTLITLTITNVTQGQTFLQQRQSHPINLQTLGGSLSLVYPIGASTLNETIQIDSANSTIRQFGSFSVPAFSFPSVTYTIEQIIPPIFPNPPVTKTTQFTIEYTLGSTSIPFDSGIRGVSWNGNGYNYNDAVTGLLIPINLSYSILADGITTTGSSSSFLSGTLFLGNEIDVQNYPTAIALSQHRLGLNGEFDFLASNGVSFTLSLVAAVPEPSVSSMMLMALSTVIAVDRAAKRKSLFGKKTANFTGILK